MIITHLTLITVTLSIDIITNICMGSVCNKYYNTFSYLGTTAAIEEKPAAVVPPPPQPQPQPQPQPVEPLEADEQFDVDNVVSMVLLGADGGNQAGAAAARAVNPLEALLGPGGFPQLLDMPQADDDEAMVELAIALSLQDDSQMQAIQQGFQQGLANLQGLEGLQNLSGQALQSLQALAAQGLGQVPGAAQVLKKIINFAFLVSSKIKFSTMRNYDLFLLLTTINLYFIINI